MKTLLDLKLEITGREIALYLKTHIIFPKTQTLVVTTLWRLTTMCRFSSKDQDGQRVTTSTWCTDIRADERPMHTNEKLINKQKINLAQSQQ